MSINNDINADLKKTKNLLNVILETSYAEFGSALEMLSACKRADREGLCYGFFHHAKDEYNHTQTFLSILKKYGISSSSKIARDFRFSSQGAVIKGYVSEKGYLVENMIFKDFIAYVYTNELLAKESFEGILKLLKSNKNEVNKIRGIMNDELRHHGLAEKYFLKYYPRLQPWQLRCYRLKETLKNKGRKFYHKNLEFLDKLFTPLYRFMAYIAGIIISKINLNEFNHKGRNLMEISPKSII